MNPIDPTCATAADLAPLMARLFEIEELLASHGVDLRSIEGVWGNTATGADRTNGRHKLYLTKEVENSSLRLSVMLECAWDTTPTVTAGLHSLNKELGGVVLIFTLMRTHGWSNPTFEATYRSEDAHEKLMSRLRAVQAVTHGQTSIKDASSRMATSILVTFVGEFLLASGAPLVFSH